MHEYMMKWENYVAEHYNPETMSREELRELGEIADIMKDMAEYWTAKDHMSMMGK